MSGPEYFKEYHFSPIPRKKDLGRRFGRILRQAMERKNREDEAARERAFLEAFRPPADPAWGVPYTHVIEPPTSVNAPNLCQECGAYWECEHP